jgi:predicted RNA-binding Zn-ribbon protein involved in translation (DUF1610 family)
VQASDQNDDAQPEPTACEACGARIAPVQSIHTEQTCQHCGKTIYNVPTEQGLPVNAGERVVIPAGAITHLPHVPLLNFMNYLSIKTEQIRSIGFMLEYAWIE